MHRRDDTKLFKRESKHRIYVNRSLLLSKINYFGFDMDYTLAEYVTPDYEEIAFKLILDRLIYQGYADDIKQYKYDPKWPIRGLWVDTLYGNMLKIDAYGNVLFAIHGFEFIPNSELSKYYYNKYVQYDRRRYSILNTLFNLPEAYVCACMVDYYSSSNEYKQNDTGVVSGDLQISYSSMYQDVRDAVDYVHMEGNLKSLTVANLGKYVKKNAELNVLLSRLKERGKFVFLVTNSDFRYSDAVMSYLLDSENHDWVKSFDAVVVDAKKPLFFGEGTPLRKVDMESGALRIGHARGPLLDRTVYSGGSCSEFTKCIAARGKDVLYIGDHIFGDILKSKKQQGWRTFLVVPELSQELDVWSKEQSLFKQLETLDSDLANSYKHMDSSYVGDIPKVQLIHQKIQETSYQMNQKYGKLGSVFRSGSRHTFFANQVSRYADLYSSSCLNLLYYPFSYLFRAPPQLMPHEGNTQPLIDSMESPNSEGIDRSFSDNRSPSLSNKRLSLGPSYESPAPPPITSVRSECDSSEDDGSIEYNTVATNEDDVFLDEISGVTRNILSEDNIDTLKDVVSIGVGMVDDLRTGRMKND